MTEEVFYGWLSVLMGAGTGAAISLAIIHTLSRFRVWRHRRLIDRNADKVLEMFEEYADGHEQIV